MPTIKKDILALVIGQSLIFKGVDALLDPNAASGASVDVNAMDEQIAAIQQAKDALHKKAADGVRQKVMDQFGIPVSENLLANTDSVPSKVQDKMANHARRLRTSDAIKNNYADLGRLQGSTANGDSATLISNEETPTVLTAGARHLKSVGPSASAKTGKSAKTRKSAKTEKSAKSIKSVKSVDPFDQCFAGSYQEVTASCADANADCCTPPEGSNSAACYWSPNVTATVCPYSCNGEMACVLVPDEAVSTTIQVAPFSCNGNGACALTSSTVPFASCNGDYACAASAPTLGEYTCNGMSSCMYNNGIVEDFGCYGNDSCTFNEGFVGKASCNGTSACARNVGTIKEGSCFGVEACIANSGVIDGGCSGPGACASNSGSIGSESCVGGDESCAGNTGDIGNRSCRGEFACEGNSGTIGNDACIGIEACYQNYRTVADGACIGDAQCSDYDYY